MTDNRNTPLVKLPPLSLPSFEGDYREYSRFRDNFRGILDKQNCDEAVKMRYLKSVVKKEPLDLISELDKHPNGYTLAWSVLDERFLKKRVTIDAHLQSIKQLQNVAEKSAVNLRALICERSKQIKILQQYDLPVDKWNTMLIYVIKPKLPGPTIEKWNETFTPDEMPTCF